MGDRGADSERSGGDLGADLGDLGAGLEWSCGDHGGVRGRGNGVVSRAFQVIVFSIITKAANLNINKIHHRMPVVLNANAAQDYLELKDDNLNFNNFEDVDLKFTEVSKYVKTLNNFSQSSILASFIISS